MNSTGRMDSLNLAICAAYRQGWEILQFAAEQPQRISLVVTSPQDDLYEERISRFCSQRNIPCIRRADVNSEEFRTILQQHAIDRVLLAWWPAIIKPASIAAVPSGWINLHPSLLPYNRGKHPYYWSIVEGTPFGVTIHLVEAGIDSGPILYQRPIPVQSSDTGDSLYHKSVDQLIDLLKQHYAELAADSLKPIPQSEESATFHKACQLDPHSHIDLDRPYRGEELLNILRGRSFPGGESAYFIKDGRKHFVRIEIEAAETETKSDPETPTRKPPKPIPMAGPSITELEIKTVENAMRHWYDDPYWYCEEFQKVFAEYHDRKYALMTPNCTSAIHLLLAGLGVGEGDEVIVPECTWIASAAPITQLRAKTVFCDIDRQTWCLDPASVEAAITDRTKAIIVVDLFGNMPHIESLQDISVRHGIPLIEDAAEALGTTYNGIKAGKFGIGSVFSFHRTKTLVTGEGGMLLLDDEKLFERCSILRDHGRRPGGEMYFNDEVAYKYMPFNVQAAIGYAQFQRLDELVGKKQWIFRKYKEKLADIPDLQFNDEREGVVNGVWITSVVFGNSHAITKQRAIDKLAALGIPGRPFFYPLSSLPAFAGGDSGAHKRNRVAYDISSRGINLPGALNLTEEQIDQVCTGIRTILDQPQRQAA